jgi:hypothetical protein
VATLLVVLLPGWRMHRLRQHLRLLLLLLNLRLLGQVHHRC